MLVARCIRATGALLLDPQWRLVLGDSTVVLHPKKKDSTVVLHLRKKDITVLFKNWKWKSGIASQFDIRLHIVCDLYISRSLKKHVIILVYWGKSAQTTWGIKRNIFASTLLPPRTYTSKTVAYSLIYLWIIPLVILKYPISWIWLFLLCI